MGAFPLPRPWPGVFRLATEPAAVPPGDARAPLLQARCVLAAVDPGPAGTNAAWRAALVARDRGAPLHLLCVQADGRSVAQLQPPMQALARKLQQRLHVTTTVSCVSGAPRQRIAELADRVGLLVLPWARGNALLDAFIGTPAERLFRSLSLPMLVVRRPAFASYRRVLVPVKLDADAVTLIAAARSVSRDPRMRIFHVLDTALEGALRLADTSERTLRLQRHRRSRKAYTLLNELITRAGAHEQGASALVSFGHVPARVLAIARAGGAQLIVAGKERRSLLSELFFGGVTQRLLSGADADVLLLPVQERAGAADWNGLPLQGPVA